MACISIRAKVLEDNSGGKTEIPVILTEQGLLEPLMDYFLENFNARSFAWMQKEIQAVELLLDYMEANHDRFDDSREFFNTFMQHLYTGTFGEDGLDPSFLCWLPQGTQTVRGLISQIAKFSDWMAQNLDTTQLKPWRESSRYDEMLCWAAYHQKYNRTFLSKSWSETPPSQTAIRARDILRKSKPAADHDSVSYFPDDQLNDLFHYQQIQKVLQKASDEMGPGSLRPPDFLKYGLEEIDL